MNRGCLVWVALAAACGDPTGGIVAGRDSRELPPAHISAVAMQRGETVELTFYARPGDSTGMSDVMFARATSDGLVVRGDGAILDIVSESVGWSGDGIDVVVELRSPARVRTLTIEGELVVRYSDNHPRYRLRAPSSVAVDTPVMEIDWRAIQHDGVIDLEIAAEPGTSRNRKPVSFVSMEPRVFVVRDDGKEFSVSGAAHPLTDRGGLLAVRFAWPSHVDELTLRGSILFRTADGMPWNEPAPRRIPVEQRSHR